MISKFLVFILYIVLFYFIMKTVKRLFSGSKNRGTDNIRGKSGKRRFDNIEEANYTIIEEKKEDKK